jgi:hypothetical protein
MSNVCKSITSQLCRTIFTLLIVSASVQAQDSLGITKISSCFDKWEDAADIAVLGDYAYIASGYTGLKILDISDPESINQVGSFDLPRRASGISLIDTLLCVTEGSRNVHILDISEPLEPEVIGIIECENIKSRAVVLDNIVYIPTSQGIMIYDISNPRDPALAGSYNQQNISAIQVRDGLAYISGRGLRIIDVSDMENIHEIGSINDPANTTGVIIDDNLAIVTGNPGFWIIDIEDPANPQQIGTYTSNNSFNCYTVDEEMVYCGTSGWYGDLEIVDISSPEEPELAGILEYSEFHMQSAIKSGEQLFIAGSRIGGCIEVVDVTEPDNPTEMNEFYPLGLITNEVHIKERYVLVPCATGGLRILDISEPDQPEEVSAVDTEYCVYDIDLAGDLAVLIDNRQSGVAIVDLTNIREPNIIGRFNSHYAGEVVIKDTLVFVKQRRKGLQILNIADPQHPTEVSLYEMDYLLTISIVGNIAYLGTPNNLSVLDISDVQNPELIGVCEGAREIANIAPFRHYLFAADTTQVILIDVEDPENPQVVPEFESIYGHHVSIKDNFAVVSEKYYGVHVLDISDPVHPCEVGFYPLRNQVFSTAITDDRKIFVGGFYNLTILDATEALSVSLPYASKPTIFLLFPANPNPFNSTTTITYGLRLPAPTRLTLFDLSGREVMMLLDGYRQTGFHSVNLSADNLSSGLYLLRLEASGQIQNQKIMLIK